MSGGGIDYAQFKLLTIIEDVKQAHIQRSQYEPLSPETNIEMQRFLTLLQLTQIYAHRFDYLFGGDDGEETFHERLINDIKDIDTSNLNQFISQTIEDIDDAVRVSDLCETKKVKMKFSTPKKKTFE